MAHPSKVEILSESSNRQLRQLLSTQKAEQRGQRSVSKKAIRTFPHPPARAEDLPPEVGPIEIAGHRIDGLSESYASVARGELLAILGSTGRLEISRARGSAAKALDAAAGTAVRVTRR